MAKTELLYILRPGDSFQPLTVNAGAGEEYSVTFLILPGVDVSVSIAADLTGAGANVRINGLYICGASERVEIKTNIRHLVPGTSSNQIVNGVAGGQARAFFDGRIIVAQDAQKTEAYQTNHNILLTEGAKVETKPQLEIYADDVKCSHGATVGQLSEEEQFYMRSRGIPASEAKVLQMISFVSEVIAQVPDPAEREALAARAEAAIREMAV